MTKDITSGRDDKRQSLLNLYLKTQADIDHARSLYDRAVLHEKSLELLEQLAVLSANARRAVIRRRQFRLIGGGR